MWLGASAQAAPSAELWDRWLAEAPDSERSIDHGPWQVLLDRYLVPADDGVNRFDYAAVGETDVGALHGYLDALATTPISDCARDEQLPYWINLYNALTVRVILEHYPVDGIRDIDTSPGFFSDGPWGQVLLSIEGEEISLDDIEHRILRPIWQDPRLHYVLNCASVGCPQLNAEAFTRANAERLLDESARAFVNHSRGVAIGRRGLTLSSLYDWYGDDFGEDEAGILAHIADYAAPPLAEALASGAEVYDYDYDWRLNDVR
ncbi:MAG: DUF547 domain-containing protein [Alphaproteobacteria bacterium]|nr:DUF547 domain-containing protein [Alphaproteobacteria bacterium]